MGFIFIKISKSNINLMFYLYNLSGKKNKQAPNEIEIILNMPAKIKFWLVISTSANVNVENIRAKIINKQVIFNIVIIYFILFPLFW